MLFADAHTQHRSYIILNQYCSSSQGVSRWAGAGAAARANSTQWIQELRKREPEAVRVLALSTEFNICGGSGQPVVSSLCYFCVYFFTFGFYFSVENWRIHLELLVQELPLTFRQLREVLLHYLGLRVWVGGSQDSYQQEGELISIVKNLEMPNRYKDAKRLLLCNPAIQLTSPFKYYFRLFQIHPDQEML